MMRSARARGLLWSLVVVGVGAALISAAVWFSRTAAAPARSPASSSAPAASRSEGVICFGTVDLERGVSSLYPLQPGRVTEVLVAENQEVAQGAELVRLEDRIARSRLAEAEAGVELAKLQLVQARKQPKVHARRVAQQRAMRDAMASRVAAARDVLVRQQQAAKSVVVNESDKFNSQEKVRELEALERAEVQRLADLEAEDVEMATTRAEYDLKAAEARRDTARLALDDCILRAPRAGTVLRILVGPGDVLGAASPVSRRCFSQPPARRWCGPPSSRSLQTGSGKASSLWSKMRRIPAQCGAAGSNGWRGGLASGGRSCTILRN